MPLGQIGNTYPSVYPFHCEFDALKESFLMLILLHDFSPNFGKFVCDSDDHRIANWCLQRSFVAPILCQE